METRGSSPLARGKRLTFGEWSEQWRLIPARAGKTPATRPATPASRAHPRSRGENVFPAAKIVVPQGSSPLTRGKLSSR